MQVINKFIAGLNHVFGSCKVTPTKQEMGVCPRYSDVMTMDGEVLANCFRCYEVLCNHYSALQDKLALQYLNSVADENGWDVDIMMDILDEEYTLVNEYCLEHFQQTGMYRDRSYIKESTYLERAEEFVDSFKV